MIIVGLDLSLTAAGITVLVDGRPKVITHVGHTGKSAASWQQRSRRIRGQVQAVMATLDQSPKLADPRKPSGTRWRFDLAVIEGPLMHGPAQAYEFDRAALWHGVYGALEAKRIPIAVVNPQTLKLWWTGNGAASKLDMLNTAMVRVREPVSTHDEADALALAYAGAHHLGEPIPFVPCGRSIEALAKVDWPPALDEGGGGWPEVQRLARTGKRR